MENITTTFKQITEGLRADNEQAILPIYYGEELANNAAFNAYRFKRFMGNVGHAAVRTVELVDKVTYHIANA